MYTMAATTCVVGAERLLLRGDRRGCSRPPHLANGSKRRYRLPEVQTGTGTEDRKEI